VIQAYCSSDCIITSGHVLRSSLQALYLLTTSTWRYCTLPVDHEHVAVLLVAREQNVLVVHKVEEPKAVGDMLRVIISGI
jgi:hypothetical protein